jgi:hypothetical protein
MAKLPEPKTGDLIPVDVRIKNVNDIPAKYFLHDEVLAALHRVIRTDVVVHEKPVPPGVDAVLVPYTMAAARKRFAVANDDLRQVAKKAPPSFIFLWLTLALIGLIVFLIIRGLSNA